MTRLLFQGFLSFPFLGGRIFFSNILTKQSCSGWGVSCLRSSAHPTPCLNLSFHGTGHCLETMLRESGKSISGTSMLPSGRKSICSQSSMYPAVRCPKGEWFLWWSPVLWVSMCTINGPFEPQRAGCYSICKVQMTT